jgi:hypothetical protein
MTDITADIFAKTFLHAYESTRSRFSDKSDWEQVFPSKPWTKVVLKGRDNTDDRYARGTQILVQVAHDLGLYYADGEPLHLDAVFFSRQPSWAPIYAAIEHENNWRTFEREVQKLLSVRCRLKVGITYLYIARSTNLERALRILCEQRIKPHWDVCCDAVGQENGDSEYLFLVGTETRCKELDWYFKAFRAKDGYKDGFSPLETAAGAPNKEEGIGARGLDGVGTKINSRVNRKMESVDDPDARNAPNMVANTASWAKLQKR